MGAFDPQESEPRLRGALGRGGLVVLQGGSTMRAGATVTAFVGLGSGCRHGGGINPGPRNARFGRGGPDPASSGWVCTALASTSAGSLAASKGHRAVTVTSAKARLDSASCRATSRYSLADRAGQAGSEIRTTLLP